MKMGIILYSNDSELVWNAFRFANLAVEQKDKVSIFLLAKGVEYESLSNEKYNILKLAQDFINNNGKILACGTCLKQRQKDGSQLCPISTMKDLYNIIRDSDKIVSF
ncbi:MAG: DsrE family protein [Elusimicrobia bacterium]|nr:DsrE family protein [Elusimicrobiota bacterium]